MSMKEGADHWAFLEDFEAPMWADLALEVKLSYKELDDEWFHRSHKFHQLPSRKLKEAFKHVDSGGKLEIDIEPSSSLKIPSSISKSRGMSYVNNKEAIDFQMSLSGKECLTDNADGETLQSQLGNDLQSQLGNDMLHKSAHEDSKLSLCIDQKNENESLVFEIPNISTAPITNNSSSWIHMEPNMCPNDPKSSITSESNQVSGPEGVVASNPIIGRRSQLLSVMKQSLRKSCTVRMATRGQITDLKQTNGLRYSSGKSSVASCSKDINVAETQRASKTPESKNVERLSQESKTRDKVKKSTDGVGEYATKTSGCGSNEEPLQSNAKRGSSYPQRTKNIDSSTVPTSLKIKSISRASECGNRGKAGLLKVLKSATSTKPTQYFNNNGSIFKVNKTATVNIVPDHSTVRKKLGVGVPMGTKAKISNKASVDVDVGKSVVAKSKQPQVMKSKALPAHRRPLEPVNLANEGSNRMPLAPVNLTNQGSSTFARKATNKGKTTDIVSKPLRQGKENIVSKLVPSKKHGNGRGVGVGVVADESNRMKLTESRKNKELRRAPVTTSKLKQRVH